MANCIAIDASSETCSVSLVVDGKTTTASTDTPRSHAKSLLPFVNELLSEQKRTIAQLDFVACSRGPGSFTGLRIGLGIAQGLAFGARKPMVGVSSLESMVRTAKEVHPDCEVFVSLLDARMGEIYWSVMDATCAPYSSVVEARLDSVEEVNASLQRVLAEQEAKSILIAGAAVELLDRTALDQSGVNFDLAVAPNAATIAALAIEKWRAGFSCRPQDFQLDYLRNSVSWNKRQRIRQ